MHWGKVSVVRTEENRCNIINDTCLFPLAQSRGLESLRAEKRIISDHQKQAINEEQYIKQ
jgi:hypothetical protein